MNFEEITNGEFGEVLLDRLAFTCFQNENNALDSGKRELAPLMKKKMFLSLGTCLNKGSDPQIA